MFKKFGAIALAAALILGGATASASAGTTIDTTYVEGTDDAAQLYNPLVVNTINLTLPQATINGLSGATNNWADEGPYLPADMSGTVNGVAFGPLHVGIHLKGAWGSWRNIYGKAGFKIKINFVDKNATFYGVQKLTLNNMVQDHSSIHETLSYRIFRSVGVPTARTGYANVFVNGQNYGLHLNLETTDKNLMNHWGITPSHMYKGGVPNFPDFWPGQESRFAVDQGSTTDFTDLTALMNVVARGNGANWFRDMSAVADLQEMTLDWATESFVGHWDGYVHNHNNFYVVRRQDGKFIMLPWGMDQTWGGPQDYWNGAALFQQCRQDSQCNALYIQALVRVVDTAASLNLSTMGTKVAAAINPSLYADPKKEFGNGEIPGNQASTLWVVNNQIQTGFTLIAAYDASLKDFGVAGTGVYLKPDQVVNVDNNVTSVRLSGHANSQNATVATTDALPLQVGDNTVAVVVTNTLGHFSQSFNVVVHRRAVVAKSVDILYSKTGTVLSSRGVAALRTAVADAPDSTNQAVTVTMQIPTGLTKAKATSLLKTRFTAIRTALANANYMPTKVTLVLGKVPAVNTLRVQLSYQR